MRARVGATLLLPATLLSLAACAPSEPAIQEVAPAKGEANVAGDAPIRVSFNQDMDHASVESRFRVRPAIEGCDQVTCPISWSGRVMILRHPQHQFATDTRYQVTIGAGYRDTRGQSAGLEHYWDFKTESAPSIGSVSPSDHATGVAVDADITVQLTRSVTVPSPPQLTLTAADDPEPVSYRLGIAPDDSRRLVLSPLALLRPKVSYTLHLGTGLQDIHHNPLSAARDFQFTTGALDLTRSLGFLVRDEGASTSSRVALLRPPAAVNAPAPSLRVLYNANRPIQSVGFTPNSSALYVLDGTGGLTVAPLDGTPATDTGISATAIAANPVRDEVAYVTGGGALHIWRRNLAATADLPQAQAGKVSGVPAWSGDGRRLAFAADDGHGGLVLRLLDRETLSIADVPGVTLAPTGTVMAWSHDGAALAFIRPAATGAEAWSYRPLAAQGSGLTRLGPIETRALSWSSDGASIFAAGIAPGSEQPLLERALGQPVDGQATGFSTIRGTQPGDSQPTAPSFDRRLAFVRQAAGMPQLWIMNNDGTGISQLTFPTYDRDEHLPAFGIDQPRWSPGSGGGG